MACICGYKTAAALARHKRTCKVLAMHEKSQEHNAELQNRDARIEKMIQEHEAAIIDIETKRDAEIARLQTENARLTDCLLYTSPSPRDGLLTRMPSSA